VAFFVDNCIWEVFERFAGDLVTLIDRNEFCGANNLA
jgi:hypothetical protein